MNRRKKKKLDKKKMAEKEALADDILEVKKKLKAVDEEIAQKLKAA